MKKVKQTQGNKKLKRYLEDLLKNKIFISEIKKLKNTKSLKKRQGQLLFLADKYSIEMEDLMMIEGKIDNNKELIWGDVPDVCRIYDDLDDFTYEQEFGGIPLEKNYTKLTSLYAYPVSIKLHKLTTKRDLLDFVEKRWEYIEDNLEMYRKRKVVKGRRNKKINNFIYEQWKDIVPKERDVDELKLLLDKKFPDNTLAYFEISNIFNMEKRRRNTDMGIGT